MEMQSARSRLEEVFNAYVDHSKLAERNRRQEYRAVILIQCGWRRKMVYRRLRALNHAATEIQRFYRGHLGRERFFRLSHNMNRELRMTYFNQKATRIQKHFRGFLSRKYIHNFYARKKFLQEALSKSTEMTKKLANFHTEQCLQDYRSAATKTQESIDKFYKSNHFKLSTYSKHGIYYSPYLTVLGEPNLVEENIRVARRKEDFVGEMRKLRKSRKPSKEELGLWRYELISAAEPYVSRYEFRMMEERRKELKAVQSQDFKRLNLKTNTGYDKWAPMRRQTEYKYEPAIDTTGWMKISDKQFDPPAAGRRRYFSCGGK